MAIPELTRRVFLRRSLHAAGAAALLPGLALGCAPDDAARAPADLKVLDPGAWAVLDAVSDAFVPAGGAIGPGARDVGLASRADAFLVEEPPAVRRGLAGALLAVEWASPVLAGRAARFSRLDLAARAACIDALRTSRFALAREVYGGLKTLCLFLFYAADASWPATGYDGPWVGRRPEGDTRR